MLSCYFTCCFLGFFTLLSNCKEITEFQKYVALLSRIGLSDCFRQILCTYKYNAKTFPCLFFFCFFFVFFCSGIGIFFIFFSFVGHTDAFLLEVWRLNETHIKCGYSQDSVPLAHPRSLFAVRMKKPCTERKVKTD